MRFLSIIISVRLLTDSLHSGCVNYAPTGPNESVRSHFHPKHHASSLTIPYRSRMQTIKPAPGAKPPSMFFVLRKSFLQQGMRGVYTGLTASLLRQMTYSMVRIGSYEEMKRQLSQNGKPSSASLLAAACLAGGLGGIAGNPAGWSSRSLSMFVLNITSQIYYLFE